MKKKKNEGFLTVCKKKIFLPIKNVVVSSYFCIRFPFLYPRNRWTGHHYDSYGLCEKRSALYRKWMNYSKTHQHEWFECFGEKSITLFGEYVQVYTKPVLDRSMVRPEYMMKLAPFKERFLYWYYGFADRISAIFHCIPTYTELDIAAGDGVSQAWMDTFMMDFCSDLKKAILKSGGLKYLFTFRITQMKEKFGVFECYAELYTPEVEEVIRNYRDKSYHICYECGRPAVKRTLFNDYQLSYCEHCLPKNKRWLWIADTKEKEMENVHMMESYGFNRKNRNGE